MKHRSRATSIPIPSLLILVTILLHSRAQEVEDEREFDYSRGSEKGPLHWGELKKEWAVCKNGEMQSPIDLSSRRVKLISRLGELKKSYESCNATIHNRGHDIALKWEGDAGSVQISGTDFFLNQSHWHSPSEHTINGRRYDLELHMVHQSKSPDGKSRIAVVGIMYKIGRPDPFLSKLAEHIKPMADKEEQKGMGVLDPSEIKMGGKKYYRYIGSLTVPPCTEGVIWTINKKIRTVSRGQVELLREAVHDYAERNARPLQPLHQRQIYLYGPNARNIHN
ncbi:hypothetical protein L6164_033732 [Bauhinia variegata]|uniref:Uncharacterized protein n=1 Tax=Bauhinia variegata TaxID=167791 RepID=A0ACB9KTE3_BAUVA|nr:hypothetical protein L6164_033732 [Bauhinia variegata]